MDGRARMHRGGMGDASVRGGLLSPARMQPAFTGIGIFPPPAPRAAIFPGLDGARAGLAADARIAAVVKRVVRNAIRAQIGPYVGCAPFRERVELEQVVRGVVVFDGDIRAGVGLCAP